MADQDIANSCCVPVRQETVGCPAKAVVEQRGSKSGKSVARIDKRNDDRSCNISAPANHRLLVLPSIDTVAIGGSWFDMGSADSAHPEDGEGPVRPVWVEQFQLATTAISNHDFRAFIDATNYKTEAEQLGSSFVFHLLLAGSMDFQVSEAAPWWRDVSGACWYSPEGVGSSIDDRWDHPVVHITRNDAIQFCNWSDTRLPTEAEWEYAARAGFASQAYPWGAELTPDGEYRCNIWQGDFPTVNTAEDGFVGTAPVTQYAANAFGLFNMSGNVWEWTADRFTNMHSPRAVRNPQGPLNGERFVAKGGSYLCHESYCLRYRTSSRQALKPNVSTGNLGFRVAKDVSS